MDTVSMDLPYAYRLRVVEAGCRTSHDVAVRAVEDFEVPSAFSTEIPTSCVLERPGKAPMPTFVLEGKCFRAPDPDDRYTVEEMPPYEALRLPPSSDPIDRWERPEPTGLRTEESALRDANRAARRGKSPARKVEDDRDARRAAAAVAYAGFLLVVDGEVVTTAHACEPCLRVWRDDDDVRVAPDAAPEFDAGSAYFSAARRSDAVALAREWAAETGGRVLVSKSRIRVVDAGLLAFDGSLAAARTVAKSYLEACSRLSQGLGLNERLFPETSGKPPQWTDAMQSAALELRRLAGSHPYDMDADWADKVLSLYGGLHSAWETAPPRLRDCLDAAVGGGRAAFSLWRRAGYGVAHEDVPGIEASDDDVEYVVALR